MNDCGKTGSAGMPKQTQGILTTALQQVSTAMWVVYRSSPFDSVTKMIFPAHTRQAVFQLVCELRCNTTKDRAFLEKHLRALQPHTLTGWLAVAATLMYSGTAGALLAAGALALIAGAVNVVVFFSLFAGLMLAGVLGVLSFLLLLGAGAASCTAFGFAAGFVFLSCTSKCLQLFTSAGRTVIWSMTPRAAAAQPFSAPADSAPPVDTATPDAAKHGSARNQGSAPTAQRAKAAATPVVGGSNSAACVGGSAAIVSSGAPPPPVSQTSAASSDFSAASAVYATPPVSSVDSRVLSPLVPNPLNGNLQHGPAPANKTGGKSGGKGRSPSRIMGFGSPQQPQNEAPAVNVLAALDTFQGSP